MDTRSLSAVVPLLIAQARFEQARATLTEAHARALSEKDIDALEHVASLFVELYCSLDPPDVAKAEAWCAEREQANGSAHNRFQTAMVLYHVAHDYQRTVAKSRQALQSAEDETNEPQRYSCLALLGQALLALDRRVEAANVMKEIEEMVVTGKDFVAGDETPFFEAACAKGLEVPTLRRVAGLLVSRCREGQFARRLSDLMRCGEDE